MDAELRDAVDSLLSHHLGTTFRTDAVQSLGGGSINAASIVSDGLHRFFLKTNQSTQRALFTAEADGLAAIAATGTLRTPQVIGLVETSTTAGLVLEAIKAFRPDAAAWRQLGRQLAALHDVAQPAFGFPQDNFIGTSIQRNSPSADWATFFRDQRLRFQFELAQQQGIGLRNVEPLLDAVPTLLAGYAVIPSLLHGDLWSGNVIFDETGQPVLIDPACYCGDAEADLAFSEFFGGFAPPFYHAYFAARPPAPGYQRRRTLYNLYHCVNHANLFGGSYRAQAQQMIDGLLRECT
ncbi:MAG: fructosamine kinase family protein [Gammaproteobacteria bacterium]|nr:fructosamine kinase family protein [Gammaproteobacteria bacterium]